MEKSKLNEGIECLCVKCGKFFTVDKQEQKNVKNCVFCGNEMDYTNKGGKI